MDYKRQYELYMDEKGIKYTELDEKSLRVTYVGDNLKTIPISVFFEEDGDPMVTLKCWEIAQFKEEKVGKGLFTCILKNKEYRWVKFYIDDDSDVVASCDSFIDTGNVGESCHFLVRTMVNIIDAVYPAFMEALWSSK